MLLKLLLIFLFCGHSFFLKAQWSENFNDGELHNQPQWIGDTSRFQINTSFQLQTNGTVGTSGETSIIATPSSASLGVRFEFFTRLNLSPSSQNYGRFYLISENATFSGNALYVQLGGSTGNTDSIGIYRQTPAGRFRVLAGLPSTMGRSSNPVRLRIDITQDGELFLYSDTTGGNFFVLEGKTQYKDVPASSYAGIFCRYTSTNIQNFFWDDIKVSLIPDTTAPMIDTLMITGNSTVELVFNEPIQKDSAIRLTRYMASGGLGSPNLALVKGDRSIELTFGTLFNTNQTYTLTVLGMLDTSNNLSPIFQINFIRQAGLLPLVINEVFPDPTPSVGLPEFEFVEIYNPNAVAVSLLNFTLSDGSTTGTFGNSFGNPEIPPDSFIIVCPVSAASDFQTFGVLAPLSPFPSLNNAGDQITLRDPMGNVISMVSYSDGWYRDVNKAQGGYTLERINPFSGCQGGANWSSSQAIEGGTPGKNNSLYNPFSDTSAPILRQVEVINSGLIALILSESADTSAAGSTFDISSGNTPLFHFFNSAGDTIFLQLLLPLQHQNQYQVIIKGIKDCQGNTQMSGKSFVFYSERMERSLDIVINEIYAAPLSTAQLPNAEYIELYNRTDSSIDLTGWNFRDASSSQGAYLPQFKLAPKSYVVICASGFASRFTADIPLIPVVGFPSLNNDQDELFLLNESKQIIHSISYSDGWHSGISKKSGGWSLEMIDPANPCSGKENWSSSVHVLGGTPGKVNSINSSNLDNRPPEIQYVYPSDPYHIQIYWNEKVDTISAININSYSISPNPGISKVYSDGNNKFTIELFNPLQVGFVYQLSYSTIEDCSGNKVQGNSIALGLLQPPDSGDLVINEVLFNPFKDGFDFVEIYNKSNRYLDLKGIKLTRGEGEVVQDFSEIAPLGWMIPPHTFWIICAEPEEIKKIYKTPVPFQSIKLNGIPSYPDDQATVGLLNEFDRWIDRMDYKDNFHSPLLSDREGVSLERVNFMRSSQDVSNWQSASQVSGGATPAATNSQYNPGLAQGQKIEIFPETFSPDGDGVDDNVSISYTMPGEGYQGFFTVFSSGGLKIKTLSSRVQLGVSGTITWNGIDDAGRGALAGVYLIVLQYFHPDGRNGQVKKTVNLILR